MAHSMNFEEYVRWIMVRSQWGIWPIGEILASGLITADSNTVNSRIQLHGPTSDPTKEIGDVWFFLNISKSITLISIPFKLLHSGDWLAGAAHQ